MDHQAVPGTFDFNPKTRVIFGPGSVARVGELAKELGVRKILLVTDPGIVAAGHADHVKQLLEAAGLAVAVVVVVAVGWVGVMGCPLVSETYHAATYP